MKKSVALVLFVLLVTAGALWAMASSLTQPVNHPVKMPSAWFDNFVFRGTHGSVARSGSVARCALLLHGIRADRSTMIARARFLKSLGFTSAALDLQAHGETPGEQITLGHLEARDAANGVDYLKSQLHCRKVVVIGQSLGGAAALLGPAAQTADALVLESVFPTIEDAIRNRVQSRLGVMGTALAPLLYWQIPLRLDVPLERLHPVDAIRSVKVPVFIMGGGLDPSTPPAETRRLFAAVPGRAQLWFAPKATHEDLYDHDRKAYERVLRAFIDDVL